MSGRVVHGEHLGHTLGFPTLNLRPVPPGCHAQPALTGVFAVMVSGIVPGKELPGVTSLGNRPSIGGNLQFTCETNLLDWAGDAYGKLIRVRFVEKLRDNKRFSGLDELIAAIHNDAIRARGISKLALGHHFDDAVETFLMSLLFEGRLSCFRPVTFMDRSGVTQIRPLIYAGEQKIINLADSLDIPIVENPCPQDKASKRYEIKQLIKTLSLTYPDMKSKVFGAMQRLPLPGWGIEK